ncbi:MAG: TRAM domain-containing protein, partial [Phototrophicaceae bacterium]
IVGFCGETEAQFQGTYDLLEELQLDKAHLAQYSPRPNTVSERRMEDDVPDEEKKRRHQALDTLQEQINATINHGYLGQTVKVLVEEEQKGKWRGRTPQNKLVFFNSDGDWRGRIADVEITWTGPWSMQGRIPQETQQDIPVSVLTLS